MIQDDLHPDEREAVLASLTQIISEVGAALMRFGVLSPGQMTGDQVRAAVDGDKTLVGLWSSRQAAVTLRLMLEHEPSGPSAEPQDVADAKETLGKVFLWYDPHDHAKVAQFRVAVEGLERAVRADERAALGASASAAGVPTEAVAALQKIVDTYNAADPYRPRELAATLVAIAVGVIERVAAGAAPESS